MKQVDFRGELRGMAARLIAVTASCPLLTNYNMALDPRCTSTTPTGAGTVPEMATMSATRYCHQVCDNATS